MLKNIKDKITLGALVVVGASLPLAFHAQGTEGLTDFEAFLGQVDNILTVLIGVLITFALLVFIWGLVKFIISAGDEEGRAKGKQLMIWGIIAFAVMIAIWGIVALLINIFGIDTNPDLEPPGPLGS